MWAIQSLLCGLNRVETLQQVSIYWMNEEKTEETLDSALHKMLKTKPRRSGIELLELLYVDPKLIVQMHKLFWPLELRLLEVYDIGQHSDKVLRVLEGNQHLKELETGDGAMESEMLKMDNGIEILRSLERENKTIETFEADFLHQRRRSAKICYTIQFSDSKHSIFEEAEPQYLLLSMARGSHCCTTGTGNNPRPPPSRTCQKPISRRSETCN